MNRHEVEARLRELDEKVKFIMKVAQATIAVGSPLDPRGVQKAIVSFDDLYRGLKEHGHELVPASPDVQQAAAALALGGRATEAGGTPHGSEAAGDPSGADASGSDESTPRIE